MLISRDFLKWNKKKKRKEFRDCKSEVIFFKYYYQLRIKKTNLLSRHINIFRLVSERESI